MYVNTEQIAHSCYVTAQQCDWEWNLQSRIQHITTKPYIITRVLL